MLTWGKLKQLLLMELDEVDVPANAVASANAAMRALAAHWSYERIYETHVRQGAIVLPDDYLEMHGVRAVDDGLIMVNMQSMPDDDNESYSWYEFPYGTLQFPAYRGDVQVFYYAYYPEVDRDSLDTQPVPIPQWAIKGVVMMTAAYSMLPALASDARLNQYNTRLDSGNPEHLPIRELINFYREQYRMEIDKWPAQKRELMLPSPRRTYDR